MSRLAVAVVLLAALALGPMMAGASAGTDSATVVVTSTLPADVCSELDPDSLAVTATTAASDEPPADDTTFHGGTTLTVVLCDSDGTAVPTRGGDGWTLAGTDAITDRTRSERSYVVRLAERNAEISFRELVKRKEPQTGLTVQVTTGAVYDSDLPGVGRLAFGNETTVREYRAAESRVLSAAADVEENASALDGIARRGNTSELVNGAGGTLTELSDANDRLSTAGNETMLLLHRSAAPGPNTTAALTAVNGTRYVSTDEALKRYVAALDGHVRSQRASIRGTVLSAMIPGIVVGILLGAVPPYRRGREIADFYQQRSGGTSEYDPGVLRWPFLAAILILLLGLALLFVTGGYQGFVP